MAVFGDLVTPYQVAAIDQLSAPIAGRFPVPPVAWAFLIDVDLEMFFDTIEKAYFGAMNPEGTHLEPTIGQIWPR